ncbi:MAG: hypothetical protein REI64_08325 [Pedobacter sp.]|uniref:hypothetical protein n=1 Tax=Pedobacter sp. TaxID=1411316 RepID=UPI002806B99D|nr:hypothetical protein [Pedobacter sp.]MDQ8004788.1 hypothetical protein [Pedobacter sp.]
MRIFLLVAILLFFGGKLIAQDPMASKIATYGQGKADDFLFIHYDKNVYANNEMIYFTGYLISPNIADHKVLSVALIRDADSLVIQERKFLMESGISFGSLIIPDSVLVGNYHLLAYTNLLLNGNPMAIFKQPITIKSGLEPNYKASLKIVKPATAIQSNNSVLLSVTSNDNRFLPKPTSVTYSYNGKTHQTKTDGFGQVALQLPILKNGDQNLKIKLKYEKDSSFMNIVLPKSKYKASVKFYPEGGNIIDGLVNNIAWEVKDERNAPMPLKAILYENGFGIDTLETNSYGIGKFRFLPASQKEYHLRLVHSELIDSNYFLPKTLQDGIALEVRNALSSDTLNFVLRTTKPQNVFVRLHNFRESFVYAPVELTNHQQNIKMPINFKGLATLTVTDSLNRPLAERMIFCNYDDTKALIVATDQENYQKRKKVELKINLEDIEQEAIVSIACVQENRIEQGKMNDIQSYYYLHNQLEQLPASISGNALLNSAYVKDILLVKGWRKYSWAELSNMKAPTKLKIDSLVLSGTIVKSNNKPINKSVSITSLGNNNIAFINTDVTGNFDVSLPATLTPFDKKLYLFITENNRLNYQINLNDGYSNLNKRLAKSSFSSVFQLPSTLVNSEELKLTSKEKVLQLREVVITKGKDALFSGKYGANACGDYVCLYNILNCRNHPGDSNNTQPIPGRQYMLDGVKITYQKCSTEDEKIGYTMINGLSMHKEFYVDSYQQPEEPAYFSTLYWNYAIGISKGQTSTIEFYTGDITSRFKIIVQGMSKKDLIYQEHSFNVTDDKK